jgi:hypothetical protein
VSACLLARAKLAQFVAGLEPQTAAAKLGTLAKAGYLASAKGLERNVISNAAFGIGVDHLAVEPIAVALDHLQAHVRSAATFGKIAPHELRTLASSMDIGGTLAVIHGVREGAADAVQLLRHGVDAAAMGDKFDVQQVTFKNPAVNAAVHGVFNILEASDKPYFGYALQRSLYQRAKLFGIRAGLSGTRLTAETDRLLANPTDGMMLGAVEDAQYATFKNRTPLSDLASGARQSIARRAETAPAGARLGYQALGLGMDIALPFTKVGSAIASASADLVPPVAMVRAIMHEAFDKNPNANGAIVKGAARSVVGGALVAAGMALYRDGKITLGASTPNQRAELETEGRQEFSVIINGRSRSVLWLGPMMPSVMLGAYLQHEGEKKAAGGLASSAVEQTADGAAFVAKTLTEASYLQSVRKVIDAVGGASGKPGRALLSAMTPTPAIVGQVRTAFDPLKRDVHTQGDAIANALPIASRSLPVKADVVGRPVPRREPGLRGVLESLLDPSSPSTLRTTPALDELARLKVTIGKASTSVRVGGDKIERTSSDRSALQHEYGPTLISELERVVSTPDYQHASDEERASILHSIIRDVKGEAAARLRAGIAAKRP